MTSVPNKVELEEFLGQTRPALLLRYGKWALIVVLVLVLGLIGNQYFRETVRIQYISSEVRRGDIAVTVTATGNLAPTNQVEVGSEISGIVVQVLVEVNDQVAKGQTLAIIDTARLEDTVARSQAVLRANEASVTQAQATVREAKAQLERLQEVSRLSGGRVPAQNEMATQVATYERAVATLRSAEANVVSARAQLSSDQKQLAKAVIRSPVSGVVLKRSIDRGQTVQASFNTPSLFIVAEDLTKMKLEVAVDEADVGQVHEGQSATFTVDAYPGRTFPATITRVNLGAKNLSGNSSTNSVSTSTVVSYLASLTFINEERTLRPGMTATATIATAGAKDVLMVPNGALRFTPASEAATPRQSMFSIRPPEAPKIKVERVTNIGVGSHQSVYVIDTNGEIRPVTVVTGATDGRYTAVTSTELGAGMAVVTGQKAARVKD